MSTTEHPMPDFTDALERHLRHAAVEHASASLADAFPLQEAPTADPVPSMRHRRDTQGARGAEDARRGRRAAGTRDAQRGQDVRRGRPAGDAHGPVVGRRRLGVAAGSLAALAVLVGVLLVLSGSGGNTPRAFGEPLVLRTPLVPLPKAARPGQVAAFVLGPESRRITTGHAFAVEGGTAYVYRNARGVCLTAPDPGTEDPELERGVTCVPTAEFRRFGISIRLENSRTSAYLAAIPRGADQPTVRVGDGAPRDLRPSDIGVVTYNATGPTVITRYGPDGQTFEDRLLQPSRRVEATPLPATPTGP